MGVRTLAKGFYLKLAWANIRRSREVYLPYMIACAIIGGIYFLVCGFAMSTELEAVPGGDVAQGLFLMGVIVFTVFAAGFLLSINRFLVKRRKKEFGLYGVLGLSKAHVGRILLLENAIVLLGGFACGLVFALVFGKLLFLLLLKLMHALPQNAFRPAPVAWLMTSALFLGVYLISSLYNLAQVHLANPIQLLQSEKRGEKDSKLVIPMALIGAGMLGAAYYYAWTVEKAGTAMGIFFILVLLVILATNLLFTSGSIAVLRALRANKRFYYKPQNFVSVSGMFHRMRQNASSLATICILSTMFLVTLCGTLSLYFGQEKTLAPQYPYNVQASGYLAVTDRLKADAELAALAQAHNVVMHADESGLNYDYVEGEPNPAATVYPDSELYMQPHSIYLDGTLYFDLDGTEKDRTAFLDAARELTVALKDDAGEDVKYYYGISDIWTARQYNYGMYGGLLFLGVFFAVLFLVVTVLMIYFKQITEGYEDKERFDILQQVGMDENQVKGTINAQVLWVFFLPLVTALLHMVFASRILTRMLQVFMLYDWALVLCCALGGCAAFALIYFVAYRMTARTYFRIVKR